MKLDEARHGILSLRRQDTVLSKPCNKCKQTFPLEDFPIKKSMRDGRAAKCFPCQREAARIAQAAYIAKDPERRRKQARDYQRRNASTYNARARVYKYGLTPEDVQEMVEAQGGVCGLCSREFSKGETFVDHDHACCPDRKTCGNCVRAILCRACNQGLGLLQDDPELLQKAINYILKYRK